MKQVGISGDYLEWKRQREGFEYAQRMHLNGDFSSISEPMVIEQPSRRSRIRRWFFSPRGALVYFGLGWAGVIAWLVWRG
jgi:hypothetical protein